MFDVVTEHVPFEHPDQQKGYRVMTAAVTGSPLTYFARHTDAIQRPTIGYLSEP